LNDIAILKLSKVSNLNPFIQIACLPKEKNISYPPEGEKVIGVGWGALEEGGSAAERLNNVALTVYNGSMCEYVSEFTEKNWDSQICSGEYEGGKDTCQGTLTNNKKKKY
jgi:hypothetical protein